MSIFERAALNTLIGMGTVFVVLILICLIIYCFRFIPMIQSWWEKRGAKEQAKAAVPIRPAPLAKAPAVQEAVQADETDDLELVAVIAAAVAASLGTTPDGFVVRSIRRRDRR